MLRSFKTFIISQKNRTDKKEYILNQFKDKPEFDLHIVIKKEVDTIGIWHTMREIVEHAQFKSEEYIIICEDDHTFTESYEAKKFYDVIKKADTFGVDLLLGGVNHFDDAVEFDNNLFWLSGFTGFQFGVIFHRFYERFLNMEMKEYDDIDLKMKEVSKNTFCVYPFISVQNEQAYSDVTFKNGKFGIVDGHFVKSEERLKTLSFLRNHFTNLC